MGILEEREAAPATVPARPVLSESAMAAFQEAVAGDPDADPPVPAIPAGRLSWAALWARLDQWVVFRWTPRAVDWWVRTEREIEFVPRLRPLVSVDEVQVFESGAYASRTIERTARGVILPESGDWQVTATIGAAPTPPDATEASRLLAEYWATQLDALPGVHTSKLSVGGSFDTQEERDPRFMAKALELSGAADLLRRYH